jgi:hypothetical protein
MLSSRTKSGVNKWVSVVLDVVIVSLVHAVLEDLPSTSKLMWSVDSHGDSQASCLRALRAHRCNSQGLACDSQRAGAPKVFAQVKEELEIL